MHIHLHCVYGRILRRTFVRRALEAQSQPFATSQCGHRLLWAQNWVGGFTWQCLFGNYFERFDLISTKPRIFCFQVSSINGSIPKLFSKSQSREIERALDWETNRYNRPNQNELVHPSRTSGFGRNRLGIKIVDGNHCETFRRSRSPERRGPGSARRSRPPVEQISGSDRSRLGLVRGVAHQCETSRKSPLTEHRLLPEHRFGRRPESARLSRSTERQISGERKSIAHNRFSGQEHLAQESRHTILLRPESESHRFSGRQFARDPHGENRPKPDNGNALINSRFSQDRVAVNDRNNNFAERKAAAVAEHHFVLAPLNVNDRNATIGSRQRSRSSHRSNQSTGHKYDQKNSVEKERSPMPKMERPLKLEQPMPTIAPISRYQFKKQMEYFRNLKTGNFVCYICKNRLSSQQSLVNHIRNLHGCHAVPGSLSNAMSRTLLAHCKAKHCVLCGSQCESLHHIKTHLARQHNVKIHVCSVGDCAKVYLHKKSLEKHDLEVHGQRYVLSSYFHI